MGGRRVGDGVGGGQVVDRVGDGGGQWGQFIKLSPLPTHTHLRLTKLLMRSLDLRRSNVQSGE